MRLVAIETAAVPKGFKGSIGDFIETKYGKVKVIGSTPDGKVKATYKNAKGVTVAIHLDIDEANAKLSTNKVKEAASTETAGKFRDFVGKVKDKLGIKKKTKPRSGGNSLGDMQSKAANSNKHIKDNLTGLMGQYAELKKSGKGDTKEAKAIGAQIGKIKNSLRKKKKD